MTVEFERRNHFNRTVSRKVLEPGSAITLQPQSFMKPSVCLDVVSENAVRIFKSFAGEVIEEISLENEQINKSRHTYSYLNRFKVSWKPANQ